MKALLLLVSLVMLSACEPYVYSDPLMGCDYLVTAGDIEPRMMRLPSGDVVHFCLGAPQ